MTSMKRVAMCVGILPLLFFSFVAAAENQPSKIVPAVLKADDYRHYVEGFNRDDEELTRNLHPNAKAWDFMQNNIPLLDYPDKTLEKIYYFRWWTFRKHIKQAAQGGFVVTEFLPLVPWAGKENAIACPGGHHFREGRWLHNEAILDDYARFWLTGGGALRKYSFWPADSLWQQSLVTGKTKNAVELLPELIANVNAWEAKNLDPCGLFWQNDGNDGMEVSVGGSGYRVTINTYEFADALAISRFEAIAGNKSLAKTWNDKALRLKKLINEKLWDSKAQFYKVAPRVKTADTPLVLQDVREEHGYTPWYADNASIVPVEYNVAWRQLTDPKGFFAPYGPTTTEQRHPGFKVVYEGHECQWNGPSWPYSTSITLTGLANLINRECAAGRDYDELVNAFRQTLNIYTGSHFRKTEKGKTVCWIDENLNPFTGDWISRTILIQDKKKSAKHIYERGKDYNHSTYCDLIINGLIGVRPLLENAIEVFPLVDRDIEYFCLDSVPYHGHGLTIFYDKTGKRYKNGNGFHVLIDGKEIHASEKLPAKPVRIDL